MEITALAKREKGDKTGPTGKGRRIFLWTVYFLAITIIISLMVDGSSYYMTPYAERPHHLEYREFRPAGNRGLAYGITGASMLILMLTYTVRKRTGLFGRRVPLRLFLDFHIFMGVFGPLLIILHTSFKVQGLVAIAFWSMVAVALSGYFGRYLYQQVPRDIEDKELSLQEINKMVAELGEELKQKGNLDTDILERINQTCDDAYIIKTRSTLGAVISLFYGDLIRPWKKSNLKRRLRSDLALPRSEFEQLFKLAFNRALLVRRLTVLSRVRLLFHYWHVIHKPFAIIMYIIMGIHIGVAIWTGYGWF